MPKRTTMTLDNDVAKRIDEEHRKSGRSIRAVVNDALRRGLSSPKVPHRRFRVKARRLELRAGVSIDDVEGALDQIEGAERR
ncbi:MAG TPA: CopG family transcriptional regulator [Thermoanaerobaculia bacterium]|nr:CopG family transcriptional regulator [Thermoanaerobaculia bacterium]